MSIIRCRIYDKNHNKLYYNNYPIPKGILKDSELLFDKEQLTYEISLSANMYDKNKIEIFEGDVLRKGIRRKGTMDNWYVTRMINGSWVGVYIQGIHLNKQKISYITLYSQLNDLEVIDNIYENKEMANKENYIVYTDESEF